MRALRELFEPHNPNSLSNRFRRRRFQFFLQLVEASERELGRPLRILDVGGTESFWEKAGFLDRCQLTILNLDANTTHHPNVTSVAGDARDLHEYGDQSFDLVFSNSVIEHVGTLDDQRRMAEEVRRVGREYFVQTPNYWFPVEPHALFPAFQWLPVFVRARLLQRASLGHLDRQPSLKDAEALVRSIRLLKPGEMRALFPDASVWEEKFLGLTKSIVVYRMGATAPASVERRETVAAGGAV